MKNRFGIFILGCLLATFATEAFAVSPYAVSSYFCVPSAAGDAQIDYGYAWKFYKPAVVDLSQRSDSQQITPPQKYLLRWLKR